MLKKIIKVTFIVIAAFLIVIQFFRIDRTNPPVEAANTMENTIAVPPDIDMILARSCNDCHSNKTIYPWYTNIQPVAWWLRDHINDGRRHLNMSEFGTYNAKKKKHKLEEICEMVEGGAMPLASYTWMHGDAVLADSEKKALCDWAKQEAEKIIVQ